MGWVGEAPVRVDLAGGTLDIWPIYAILPDSLTVNVAIDRYQRVTTEPSPYWVLEGGTHFPTWTAETLTAEPPEAWRLVWMGVRAVVPPSPLRIRVTSEVPPGSGLGGSSALMVALLGTLARWRGTAVSRRSLVRQAYFLETQVIQVPTGLQDHLAAAYGGCHAWQWTWQGWERYSLARARDWVLAHLLLVYVGESRFSGRNNWEVFQRLIEGDASTRRAMEAIRRAAHALVEAIERRDDPACARAIRQEMDARGSLHPAIVTPAVADVLAWRDPAIGAAKVCGAGGGGCLLLWVDPEARTRLTAEAQARGWMAWHPRASGHPFRVMFFPTFSGPAGGTPQ